MTDTLERLQAALADRYTIERELGAGGMATVFLAADLKHGRRVAIKVLHPELGASIGTERFEREIRLAASLQHPHILSLYDSGEADGLLYYVMPYVIGESLRDRINRDQMLPVEDAIQIALEVADALGYAHAMGIVHRDIKPENIMLSGGHALVADFGIARATISAGEKLTQTGVAIGTPLYMSPEQAVGEVVGPTADLYSLGCVLFEMLAGDPPFTGNNARAIMARHAMTPAPSIQEVRPTVPDEVEDAVMACLAKVPADRPQTASQFCDMLGTPMGATAARRSVGSRMSSARHSQLRVTAQRMVPTRELPALEVLPIWRRPAVIGFAALVVIGAALAGWRLTGHRTPIDTLGGPQPSHLAVLYFEDLSPKQDLGYLADGLTEGLISALASVQGLSVISRGGVAPYRDGKVARDSIARALQVGTLVIGSVEPQNDSIQVTLRLLDDAGIEREKASFRKSGKDLVALSDSLAGQAAVLVRKRIGAAVQLTRTRAGTRNTDAWAMYQRAIQARDRGDSLYQAGNLSELDRAYHSADSMAILAQRLDPQWSDPVILRGMLDYWRARRATDDAGLATRMVDSGTVLANQALDVDRNDAAALELRGDLIYYSYLRGLEPDPAKHPAMLLAAQKDLEQATQLDPSRAGAWAMLSHLYANHPDKTGVDVVLAATKALETDAYLSNADVIISRLALANYDLGQFVDAKRWCNEGRRRYPADPRFVSCALLIMTAKLDQPDPARARRLADSVVAFTKDPIEQRYQRLYTQTLVAGVLARAGQRDSARALLRSIKPDPEADPSSDLANTSAFIWTLVGDTTEAVNQIKAFLVANPGARNDFRDHPNWWFLGISNDPRYRQAVGAPR